MIGAQEKKIRRIMIAAPKSGSGKTMIHVDYCRFLRKTERYLFL
ncbi:MAG: hypothetical protein ACLUTY_04715 [Waltera sp.]